MKKAKITYKSAPDIEDSAYLLSMYTESGEYILSTPTTLGEFGNWSGDPKLAAIELLKPFGATLSDDETEESGFRIVPIKEQGEQPHASE